MFKLLMLVAFAAALMVSPAVAKPQVLVDGYYGYSYPTYAAYSPVAYSYSYPYYSYGYPLAYY